MIHKFHSDVGHTLTIQPTLIKRLVGVAEVMNYLLRDTIGLHLLHRTAIEFLCCVQRSLPTIAPSNLGFGCGSTLRGKIDVASATLDEPDRIAPPVAVVQTSERIGWAAGIHALPEFERYPGYVKYHRLGGAPRELTCANRKHEISPRAEQNRAAHGASI